MKNLCLLAVWVIGLSGCFNYAGNCENFRDDTGISVSRVFETGCFDRIDCSTVGTVYFTQADHYSCRIEGSESIINKYEVVPSKKTLEIRSKKGERHFKRSAKIYITAPTLRGIDFTGVGNLNIEEPMICGDFDLEVSGVGNVDIRHLTAKKVKMEVSGIGNVEADLNCTSVVVDVSGVGDVTLTGKTKKGNIMRTGIGKLNTKKLIIGGE